MVNLIFLLCRKPRLAIPYALAGIGVGGAPSGDIDASCAAAGLKAIGAAE